MNKKLSAAVQKFSDRQSRAEHPDGTFDSKGRWDPSGDEKQSCCNAISSPSKAFPYSLMLHCRTARHIARLTGVDEQQLTATIRQQSPPRREGGDHYYKAVALDPDTDQLVSIYDGTIYELGKRKRQTVQMNHGGGYYVYSDIESARNAKVPESSKFAGALRFIVRVLAGGKYHRYGNKVAFSEITPLEIVG